MRNGLHCRPRLAGALAIAIQLWAPVVTSEWCWASPTEGNGKVTGTVVDPIAAVVPNATIIFLRAGAPEFRVMTGALGNFEASLPPNTYEVRVDVRGFRQERRTVEVQTQRVAHLTFTLAVAKTDTAPGDFDRVDEVEIPDSVSRLHIEYGPPIRRVQSDKITTYQDVSYSPEYAGNPRAVVARYGDLTIWASKLELFNSPKVVHASGYVLLDDGINLPKHVEDALLSFDKGAVKLETPK